MERRTAGKFYSSYSYGSYKSQHIYMGYYPVEPVAPVTPRSKLAASRIRYTLLSVSCRVLFLILLVYILFSHIDLLGQQNEEPSIDRVLLIATRTLASNFYFVANWSTLLKNFAMPVFDGAKMLFQVRRGITWLISTWPWLPFVTQILQMAIPLRMLLRYTVEYSRTKKT